MLPQNFAVSETTVITQEHIDKIDESLKKKLLGSSGEKLNIIIRKKEVKPNLIAGIMGIASAETTEDVVLRNDGEIKKKTKEYISAEVTSQELAKLITEGNIDTVYADNEYNMLLDESVPSMDAEYAWDLSYDGSGIKIAVLDTGVDYENEAFGDRIILSEKFVDSISTLDNQGHGTHVAGIIAGDGKYKGVAPDAYLLNAKVLDDQGRGSTSSIIEGIEWAVENDADIISLSLGAPVSEDVPLNDALQDAIDNGVIVVAASGNCGNGCMGFEGVTSPGNYKGVITVGAVDDSMSHADFSSGQEFEDYIKPDVSAPGVEIMSYYASGTYKSMSGTSMAAPHVSGAAALLLEKNSSLDHHEVKAVFEQNAVDLGVDGKDVEFGSGFVDVEKLFFLDEEDDIDMDQDNSTYKVLEEDIGDFKFKAIKDLPNNISEKLSHHDLIVYKNEDNKIEVETFFFDEAHDFYFFLYNNYRDLDNYDVEIISSEKYNYLKYKEKYIFFGTNGLFLFDIDDFTDKSLYLLDAYSGLNKNIIDKDHHSLDEKLYNMGKEYFDNSSNDNVSDKSDKNFTAQYGGGTPEEAYELQFDDSESEFFRSEGLSNWYYVIVPADFIGDVRFKIEDIDYDDDLDLYVYDYQLDLLCNSNKLYNSDEVCTHNKWNDIPWKYYIKVLPYEIGGMYAEANIVIEGSCDDTWLDEYRCNGDSIERKRQYDNCDTSWEAYRDCSDKDYSYSECDGNCIFDVDVDYTCDRSNLDCVSSEDWDELSCLGDSDYCHEALDAGCACTEGEGDCDSSGGDECAPGLYCDSSGWGSTDYCCPIGSSWDGNNCEEIDQECILADAYWNKFYVTETEEVTLTVTGNSYCNGKTATFDVWEIDGGYDHSALFPDEPVGKNPSSVTFDNGKAETTWIAEWQDDALGDPEYYFVAKVDGKTISEKNLLNVSKCQPQSYQGCSDNKLYWYDSCGRIGKVADSCEDICKDNGKHYNGRCDESQNKCVYQDFEACSDCSAGICQPCNLDSATWSTTEADEGEIVTLKVTGPNNCEDKEVSFKVYEQDWGKDYESQLKDDPVNIDPESAIFKDGMARTEWVAEYQSDIDTKYYFVASVDGLIEVSEENLYVNDCEDKESYRCSEGDVYYYNSCGNRGGLKQDCGEDGEIGTDYCYQDDVYRDFEEKGCYIYACTIDTTRILQKDCGDAGCEGGLCRDQYCGDGRCDSWEDTSICPQDCNEICELPYGISSTCSCPALDCPTGYYCDSNQGYGTCVENEACEIKDGSASNCDCDEDDECPDGYYCDLGAGWDACVIKDIPDECNTIDKYSCKDDNVYRCEQGIENKKLVLVDICAIDEVCPEDVAEHKQCKSNTDYKLKIEYASPGTIVNKQKGDSLFIKLEAADDIKLDFEYPDNAITLIDGNCDTGNFKSGENICRFEVKTSAPTKKFNLKAGDDVEMIHILEQPYAIYITHVEQLHNRYDDQRAVEVLLAKTYEKASQKRGVVYDLSNEIESDHPFDQDFKDYNQPLRIQ